MTKHHTFPSIRANQFDRLATDLEYRRGPFGVYVWADAPGTDEPPTPAAPALPVPPVAMLDVMAAA